MKQIKKIFSLVVLLSVINISIATAQCALCTKTAQQLGAAPAQGLNKGILYLMTIPLALLFYIGYRWYKREKALNKENNA